MDIKRLMNDPEVQSPRPAATSGPVPQLTAPTTHDSERLVGINSHGLSLSQIEHSLSQAPLLAEPPAKKQFDSPASKKSSASVASVSTGATGTYKTSASTHTPSPVCNTTSFANIAATPADGTSPPNYASSAYQPASAAFMQGGPVLPAIAEPHRHLDPDQPLQFRPLYSGTPVTATTQLGPPGSDESPPSQMLKRAASQTLLPEEPPAKKQTKWTPEEDNLTIQLRGRGMKWDDIAKCLPGRSSVSCRLRFQNYLEKRAVWDEEKKNKLAWLYARLKQQMWQEVATMMSIPWRSVESMHWQLGEQEISARAIAPVFQPHHQSTDPSTSGTSTGDLANDLTWQHSTTTYGFDRSAAETNSSTSNAPDYQSNDEVLGDSHTEQRMVELKVSLAVVEQELRSFREHAYRLERQLNQINGNLQQLPI